MLQAEFNSLRQDDSIFAQEYKENDFIEWVADMHEMDSNGFAYFNDDNFRQKNDAPCYIPENAETEDDVFSYKDLVNEVEEWMQTEEAKAYIEANENQAQTVESWVQMLYEDLEWQSPSTLLLEYSYNY